MENLNCLGCPKQAVDFVALGLSSGQVGLVNYRNSEYIAKFPAGNGTEAKFEQIFLFFIDYKAGWALRKITTDDQSL